MRLAGISTAGFVLLAVLVRLRWSPLLSLDRTIALDLNDHQFAIGFWHGLSAVLSPTVLRIAGLVLAALLAWRGRARAGATIAATMIGMAALSTLTKWLVDRDRPVLPDPIEHAAGQSYPSGHALTSFAAAALALALLPAPLRRRLALPLAVLVAAVGWSRLALGVHFLSDVVGGWLLALAWVALVVTVARRSTRADRGGDQS